MGKLPSTNYIGDFFMFYEEKVLNGRLCFRTRHNGEWQEISYEVLLTKYLAKKKELERIHIISEKDGPEQHWEDSTLGNDETTANVVPSSILDSLSRGLFLRDKESKEWEEEKPIGKEIL